MLAQSIITLSSILSIVAAHGYSSTPRARQVICKKDGGYWWPKDGSNVPNAACKAAFLESGTEIFTDAHGFAKNVRYYDNIDKVQEAIPDGTLCAAGSSTRSGMDYVSPFWQKNSVALDKNGAFKMDIEFCAHAPHSPSFWDVYISKPHYNSATAKLGWNDLEKIAHFGNLSPISGSAKNCDAGKYYKLKGIKHTVPLGQEGAVMYVRWQRQDPAGEGFYNCIDLQFDNAVTQSSASMPEERILGSHQQNAGLEIDNPQIPNTEREDYSEKPSVDAEILVNTPEINEESAEHSVDVELPVHTPETNEESAEYSVDVEESIEIDSGKTSNIHDDL